MSYRRKLIEVSLPLEAINKESAREKSIRHGHPSTLHLWWSRKPLAASRAVLFSSLVDDPSEYMLDEASANEERERLFKILEDLVLWENVNNNEVLDKARLEIARSVARNLSIDVPVGKEAVIEFLGTKAPPIFDPFAGGGSIPLEAQRLGLRAYASDLNPISVLINKTLIEIPPKFAGMPPIHLNDDMAREIAPKKTGKKGGQGELWTQEWKGAQGLAEDVRYYGEWMRKEAEKRIGQLYPKVKITSQILAERPDLKAQGLKLDDELTVIAWLWARTVKCPNPACGAEMPLITKFWLNSKGKTQYWVEPFSKNNQIKFKVKTSTLSTPDESRNNTGTMFLNTKGRKSKAIFVCAACGSGIAKGAYIDSQYNNHENKSIPVAIVAELINSRVYLDFDEDLYSQIQNEILSILDRDNISKYLPTETARGTFASNAQGRHYGFNTFSDYFLKRQLLAIATLAVCIGELEVRVKKDANLAQLSADKSKEYSDAITTYLSLLLDKGINLWSSLSSWMGDRGAMRETFSQQGIAMAWDFAEANPFSDSGGGLTLFLEKLFDAILFTPAIGEGKVAQLDATQSSSFISSAIIVTDPPYYNNISYADIMDFFYVWQRKILNNIYPELFQTILIPKSKELVADPNRFEGDGEKAKQAFEFGLSEAFKNIFQIQYIPYPSVVFYAFKQAEAEETSSEVPISIASTGWETMLEGLIKSGFVITGTWPIKTESSGRNVAQGSNALASSIVLVCRPRSSEAGKLTRREFLTALKKELPPALRQLQLGSIAPVDFAQAAIGPGMAVFSRYQAVLESDGSPMRIRIALALINQSLDDYLSEQEGEYDGDTRWALAWYEQFGHNEAPYGVAETLSTAKNTSVHGLEEAGILVSRGGKVRLLKREELDPAWNPATDKRLTVWEAAQHLIQALDKDGEQAAGTLLNQLGGLSETIRDLGYRLYTICERKGWSQDALAYNMLVVAWPRLKELAARQEPGQGKLL